MTFEITSRRQLLGRASLLLGAGFVGLPKAAAQGVSLLATELPALERRAGELGLPEVAALRRSGPRRALTEQNLYLEAMPRLVQLIERGLLAPEGSPVAERAAELLSDLNFVERGQSKAQVDTRRGPVPAYESLKSSYEQLFRSCTTRPTYVPTVTWHLGMLRRGKPRYEKVGEELGIPWFFVGITHALEASFNFLGHLHNGDYPLTSRTKHVPSNRPKTWLPPSDWESSAKDALIGLGFAGQQDWSVPRILYRCEAYNGFGYRRRSVNTPYLWSFSNHYLRGKFVRDGVWDPNAASKQCGAAVLLRALSQAGDISV